LQSSILTTLLLPVVIGIIMFGLGLSLTLEDFRRVARYPVAVGFGLFLQTVLLPFAALVIALMFKLSPEFSIGLMLLAAAPGGASANIYSHLARGDVALNITLTAVNSILCLVTLPIVLNLSLGYFLGAGQYVPPPTRKVVEVAAIILVPVIIGMAIRARFENFALRAEIPIKIFAIVVLAALIVVAVYLEWQTLVDNILVVGGACLAFNLVSMLTGYLAPLALRLPRKQAIAIAMEIGIHNGALAIFVALNVLNSPAMSVPAGVYSLIMYFTAAAFAFLVTRRAIEEKVA
jgi:BASS family bile acid:Na+ symporter